MFAAGRIIRHRRESSINGIIGGGAVSQLMQRPKKKRRKFRCYVPFVWQALLATGIGMLIIAAGTAMCVIGYHAGQYAGMGGRRTAWNEGNDLGGAELLYKKEEGGVQLYDDGSVTPFDNGDQAVIGGYGPVISFSYIGPILMSCGCFAIVFSCVVVCETRDRVIEIIEDREKRGLERIDIQIDFFKLVMEKKYQKQRILRQREHRPDAISTISGMKPTENPVDGTLVCAGTSSPSALPVEIVSCKDTTTASENVSFFIDSKIEQEQAIFEPDNTESECDRMISQCRSSNDAMRYDNEALIDINERQSLLDQSSQTSESCLMFGRSAVTCIINECSIPYIVTRRASVIPSVPKSMVSATNTSIPSVGAISDNSIPNCFRCKTSVAALNGRIPFNSKQFLINRQLTDTATDAGYRNRCDIRRQSTICSNVESSSTRASKICSNQSSSKAEPLTICSHQESSNVLRQSIIPLDLESFKTKQSINCHDLETPNRRQSVICPDRESPQPNSNVFRTVSYPQTVISHPSLGNCQSPSISPYHNFPSLHCAKQITDNNDNYGTVSSDDKKHRVQLPEQSTSIWPSVRLGPVDNSDQYLSNFPVDFLQTKVQPCSHNCIKTIEPNVHATQSACIVTSLSSSWSPLLSDFDSCKGCTNRLAETHSKPVCSQPFSIITTRNRSIANVSTSKRRRCDRFSDTNTTKTSNNNNNNNNNTIFVFNCRPQSMTNCTDKECRNTTLQLPVFMTDLNWISTASCRLCRRRRRPWRCSRARRGFASRDKESGTEIRSKTSDAPEKCIFFMKFVTAGSARTSKIITILPVLSRLKRRHILYRLPHHYSIIVGVPESAARFVLVSYHRDVIRKRKRVRECHEISSECSASASCKKSPYPSRRCHFAYGFFPRGFSFACNTCGIICHPRMRVLPSWRCLRIKTRVMRRQKGLHNLTAVHS